MIPPAQRTARVVVKALCNAPFVEAMSAQTGRPPVATTLLKTDGAGGRALFATDATLLQGDAFPQETVEHEQVANKYTFLSSLRSAKCNSNETLHPVHQKPRPFAIRLKFTNHCNNFSVNVLNQYWTNPVFDLTTAKYTPHIAQELLHGALGHTGCMMVLYTQSF